MGFESHRLNIEPMVIHARIQSIRQEIPAPREELLGQIEHVEAQLKLLRASLVDDPQPEPEVDQSAAVTGVRIRRLLKARRARSLFFEDDLFADPAWDVLLEAYAAHLMQQKTSVTALSNAAAVPATTALRWIRRLEQLGLLVRRGDPLDGRRSWMEISNRGLSAMQRYLNSVSLSPLI